MTRATVLAGTVTAVARASPEVLSPMTRPAASTSGPPENPSYTARSSRTNRSMVPPCQVRHSPPTALTMPRLAVTDPPGRPSASTSCPTRGGSVAGATGGAPRALRETEHGEVGGRVPPGQRRGDAGAVVQADGDVVVPLNGVVRRDDDARLPDDARCRNPAPGVDGDDRAPDGVHRRGEIVGDGGQQAVGRGCRHERSDGE